MNPFFKLKRFLQEHRDSTNPILFHAIASLYSVHRVLWRCKPFLTDDKYRCATILKFLKPQEIHQTTTLTAVNRYPEIFSVCRDYLGDGEDLSILSFGCSTGEEVMSLRHYFPRALIIGAEINARALATCRQRQVDDRIKFVHSDRETIERQGPFDAIFCMAVLQRTPHRIMELGITDLKPIYPFEKFDRQVKELDLSLRENGLLVIYNTQYVFGETSTASRYETLKHATLEDDTFPKFNRNSIRIENPRSIGSIFIKKHNG